jgi:hypothetical protein
MTSQKVEARISDGALVVAFTGGTAPRLWRGDLAHIASSVFEVMQKNGKFFVVMKASGNTEEIGMFDDGASATRALEVIMAALAGKPCARPSGFFKKLLKAVFYLFLVAVAGLILLVLFVPPPTAVQTGMPAPAIQQGVPVPADQLFGK